MAESQVPVSKSKPVLIMAAVLAGLQVVAGGAVLGDIIGAEAFGVFVLLVAALQVGWGVYVTGQVTPWVDVVAKAGPGGGAFAGPAAAVDSGAPVVVTRIARARPESPYDERGVSSLVFLGGLLLLVGLVIWWGTRFDLLGIVGAVAGAAVVAYGLSSVRRP